MLMRSLGDMSNRRRDGGTWEHIETVAKRVVSRLQPITDEDTPHTEIIDFMAQWSKRQGDQTRATPEALKGLVPICARR